jgi:hypothetical protein
MYASQIWATPYSQQGKEMDSPLQKLLLAGLNRMLGGGQRHHAFMVCHARVWIGTPTVQLVLRGNAAVQFSEEIQQLHNE